MTGTIFLERGELSASETDGSILIPIVRTGDLSGAVTIQYGITDDTAQSGLDYHGPSGTITMAPGESRVVVPVSILDDLAPEQTEVFVLSIISVEGGTLIAPRTTRISILDNENPVTDPPEPPLSSNYVVTEQAVAKNLSAPVSFEFSPIDPSRAYIVEHGGKIKVYDTDTGASVSTFVDLSSKVNNYGDRGLIDIALHPDFANNPYVYAFYVVDPSDTAGKTGRAAPDGGGNRFAYVVRLTADASTGYTTVVPGSEVVLVGGGGKTLNDISGKGAIDSTSNLGIAASDIADSSDPSNPVFKQDYIKVDSTSHMGGSLVFGPDGALYVSIGDGTSFDATDPRAVGVQNVNSLSGKILRIDPMTGKGLPDNPFVATGDDLGSNHAKVFALGLRHPYSTGFDGDGRLLIAETGWNSYEEINVAAPGANFGWPFYEGGDNGVNLPTPGYRDLPQAAAFYAAVERGEIHVTPPFRAFSHDSSAPGYQVQTITGGDTVYTGSRYPSEFLGDYFFTDFSEGEVYSIDIHDRRDVKFLYKTSSGFGPTHFSQGPDGYEYYVNYITGEFGRLVIEPKPVAGTSGNDRIVGTRGNDLLAGLDGNDTLDGGIGNDTFSGGAGVDTVVFTGAAGAKVNLALTTAQYTGYGLDRFSSIENLIGGLGANTFTGNGAANRLVGNGGNDVLNGGAGNDTLVGGAGNDVLNGGTEADTADYSTATANLIVSLATTTAQFTGQGKDTLISIENLSGGTGNDRLTGSSGNNVFAGGLGNDTLDGGAGIDTADYRSASTDVIVNLATGIATGQGTDRLIAIENLIGGAGADTLIGSAGSNVLAGGAGADSLDGGAGIDTVSYARSADGVSVSLFAGSGSGGDAEGDILARIENLIGSAFDDMLEGNAGANVLNGGTGIDTVAYASSSKGVTVNLALTTAQGGTGHAIGDVLLSIENLIGSAFADNMAGSSAANRLEGGRGNDILNGQAGNDTLVGGAGNDRLTGSTGRDTFEFAPGFGNDVVSDFAAGLGPSDVVQFQNGMFSDFDDLLAHAKALKRVVGTTTVTDVVITYDADPLDPANPLDTLILRNGNTSLKLTSLSADDFRFF